MTALDDIRAERIKKLEALRAAGVDPYPARTGRTHTLAQVRSDYTPLEASQKVVTVAGRVMSLRGQGGIIFADLFDGTDRMQVVLKKETLGDAPFDFFQNVVDQSDFIEVSGTAFTTKRGEQSVLATAWKMLSKSLRPIPTEWFGIKDEDERYRKRYLDMLLNPEVAAIVHKRSVFWNTIRTFMLEREFLEVETPVLETTPGGAEAEPFVTHHNALDIDVYLRISAGELWQKKLMVAGIPKTFEIGRIFRNEGMSYSHAQDYTQLEFYEAYSDLEKGKKMIMELYRIVAQAVCGSMRVTHGDSVVDLGGEWKIYDFNEFMQEQYAIDPRSVTENEVLELLRKHTIAHEQGIGRGRGIDLLWKKVRKSIIGPGFLVGVPIYLEPLAKKSTLDTRVVERFQVILGGSEIGKGFSELNDPIDQKDRFMSQLKLRDMGDKEAQIPDFEYVEAMEYGMPPAFGFGVSERFFSFLMGVPIREGQLFPLMRPKE